MKRIFQLIAVFLLSFSSLFGQEFFVEKSMPFDEPTSDWFTLLQLKNGTTFFVQKNDDGIDMAVYDKARKLVAKKVLKSTHWEVDKETHIRAIYEINGELVMFLMVHEDRTPVLYRIRLNPNNGMVVNDEEVGRLQEMPKSWIGTKMYNISVVKDRESDCYAVIFFGFNRDQTSSLKVCHFDGMHKKINEADYNTKDEAYKSKVYNNAVVDGDKNVYLVIAGYTKIWAMTGDCNLIISKLSKGNHSFKDKLLETSNPFKDFSTSFFYNNKSKKLQLKVTTLADQAHKSLGSVTVNYYQTILYCINNDNLSVLSSKSLSGEKVEAYAKKHINEDYTYSGVPSGVVLNDDNTLSVLMEKKESFNGKISLGPIGISVVSDDGTELGGYVISKKQELYSGFDNHKFMSFDYVNARTGNYVIFNDYVSNTNKEEQDDKRKKMKSASVSSAVCYKLGVDSISKAFLFGDPEKSSSAFCYTRGNDYNKDLNTFATIMVEREGQNKQARIAWVNFDRTNGK